MNTIKQQEKYICCQEKLIDDKYCYLDVDYDGNIYCRYDQMNGTNHFNLETYKKDLYCLYVLEAELKHQINMVQISDELHKIFVKKELKSLSILNNMLNNDVLDVIGSYISGTNGTLLNQISLL